jgi:hypothetical protein
MSQPPTARCACGVSRANHFALGGVRLSCEDAQSVVLEKATRDLEQVEGIANVLASIVSTRHELPFSDIRALATQGVAGLEEASVYRGVARRAIASCLPSRCAEARLEARRAAVGKALEAFGVRMMTTNERIFFETLADAAVMAYGRSLEAL